MKMPMLLPIVKKQLHNATVLLDKGYNIWTEVEPLLEKWGSVEDVPERDTALSIQARIAIVGDPKDHSSTDYLKKIQRLFR